EEAVAFSPHRDQDPNSIDVFYISPNPGIKDPTHPNLVIPGVTYNEARLGLTDQTKKKAAQNFIVLVGGKKPVSTPFVLAHELMHILLNRGHRITGTPGSFTPLDPNTALFFGAPGPNSKRIGPYPQSSPDGNEDTRTIR